MKTRKMLAISLIIFIMVSCATIVSASSFKFIAAAQKEIFKPGEEVVVSLDIDEIDAGVEGINVVEMSLEYDKNVFDSMEFVKENNWDSTYNDSENSEKFGKLLYTNISTGITEAETIGRIKFKLKDNLPDMETEIKLLSVTSNDGKVLMPEGDRIIKIKIVSDKTEPEKPEKPQEPEKTEEPQKIEEPQKTEEPTKPEKKPEEKITIIPQTGQTRIIYVVIGIVIACALIALAIGVVLSGKSENSQTKKEDKKEANKDNNNNNE